MMGLGKRNKKLFVMILLLASSHISEAYGAGHISLVNLVKRPPDTIHSLVGRTISFEWKFSFDKEMLKKHEHQPSFIFGEWKKSAGYIHNKLLLVQTSTIQRLRKDDYDNKIQWKGDMSTNQDECYGKVTLLNLTVHDFKYYAVNIFAANSLPPRQDVFKLVLGEGAKNLTLKQTQSKTPILVCEATGQPTPHVQIHNDAVKFSLANGTGTVTYQVKQSGHYYCSAQSMGIDNQPITSDKQYVHVTTKQQQQQTSSPNMTPMSFDTTNQYSKSTTMIVNSIIAAIPFIVYALSNFIF